MRKYDYLFNDISDDAVVSLISQKLQSAGNRSERRKILKSLNNSKNIASYAREKISKVANEKIDNSSRESFGYIMSMAGIILHDKYEWDDASIGDFFTAVSHALDGEWSEGKSVEDVARELEEKTGIELRVE